MTGALKGTSNCCHRARGEQHLRCAPGGDTIYRVCCGLDVHKDTVVACLRSPGSNGQRHKEVRTYGTTTAALGDLAAWLTAAECSHVAMESTGVYWRPVYAILEAAHCTLL